MFETDKLKFVQDNHKTLSVEQMAKHVGCSLEYFKKKYKRYIVSDLPYHTVVHHIINNDTIVDDGESLKELKILPKLPKSWVCVREGNLIRWREPKLHSKRYQNTTKIEVKYKKYIRNKLRSHPHSYMYVVGKTRLKFLNKTVEQVKEELGIDSNTFYNLRKEGIIRKLNKTK